MDQTNINFDFCASCYLAKLDAILAANPYPMPTPGLWIWAMDSFRVLLVVGNHPELNPLLRDDVVKMMVRLVRDVLNFRAFNRELALVQLERAHAAKRAAISAELGVSLA